MSSGSYFRFLKPPSYSRGSAPQGASAQDQSLLLSQRPGDAPLVPIVHGPKTCHALDRTTGAVAVVVIVSCATPDPVDKKRWTSGRHCCKLCQTRMVLSAVHAQWCIQSQSAFRLSNHDRGASRTHVTRGDPDRRRGWCYVRRGKGRSLRDPGARYEVRNRRKEACASSVFCNVALRHQVARQILLDRDCHRECLQSSRVRILWKVCDLRTQLFSRHRSTTSQPQPLPSAANALSLHLSFKYSPVVQRPYMACNNSR